MLSRKKTCGEKGAGTPGAEGFVIREVRVMEKFVNFAPKNV